MPPNTTTIRYRNGIRDTEDYLRAENDRLYILLADTLKCACANQPFEPADLLQAIAARRGLNLAKAHHHDRPPTTTELVQLLRRTRPDGRRPLEDAA